MSEERKMASVIKLIISFSEFRISEYQRLRQNIAEQSGDLCETWKNELRSKFAFDSTGLLQFVHTHTHTHTHKKKKIFCRRLTWRKIGAKKGREFLEFFSPEY